MKKYKGFFSRNPITFSIKTLNVLVYKAHQMSMNITLLSRKRKAQRNAKYDFVFDFVKVYTKSICILLSLVHNRYRVK